MIMLPRHESFHENFSHIHSSSGICWWSCGGYNGVLLRHLACTLVVLYLVMSEHGDRWIWWCQRSTIGHMVFCKFFIMFYFLFNLVRSVMLVLSGLFFFSLTLFQSQKLSPEGYSRVNVACQLWSIDGLSGCQNTQMPGRTRVQPRHEKVTQTNKIIACCPAASL